MGNNPSKSQARRSRGQFGDFTADHGVKGSTSSSPPRHTGTNYLSAPPPYTSSPNVSPTEYSPSPSPINNHPEASSAKAAYLRTPLRAESWEDALQTLRQYDTIILMDDSTSMTGSLWREAKKALATLADVASQYDTNGVDVHFLNNYESMTGVKDAQYINERFATLQPGGPTPIGHRLDIILGDYFRSLDAAKKQEDAGDAYARKQVKPVNIIIITDGEPTDDPESVIVSFARRLDIDNWPLAQVGIQFVQIGTSRRATRFLQELDDSLKYTHRIRDIVDTTPYIGKLSAEMLIKVLLGGINRRVDTKGGAAVMF